EGLEGTSGSLQPREHAEEEQPPAKPTPSSPRPSPGSERGAAGPKPRAELCPPASLGIPAGRGALLRQEAIAPREDGGTPESPDEALEKGSPQPEPQRVPGRSWSGAGSAEGGQGELRPGGTRGDSSSEAGICPGEQREGDAQRSPGVEKPPELPKEQAEGRRAEVCPWESREQGRSVRAEICPWDTEQEQEGRGSPKSPEQPGMGPAGKAPAVPKPSGTVESAKANICPWEVEDELRPKSEICPWEEAAAPSGKERLSQDTHGTSTGEEKVGSRALEKGKQPQAKPVPKSPSGKSQSSE
ncbi:GP179 protein, partial [Pachycephala philippinensis]|nr:GP179 protein [Pachycephala philippinensis]